MSQAEKARCTSDRPMAPTPADAGSPAGSADRGLLSGTPPTGNVEPFTRTRPGTELE
ncbi:hypothetical protein [Streptomyces lydicus]|uniref:hypothetical protein n=1 Tax=Streptomyces lydicus TaxID=47763 RepID=UPI0013E2DD8F|nr:hypothetical protein [Streptomyces lydicus]